MCIGDFSKVIEMGMVVASHGSGADRMSVRSASHTISSITRLTFCDRYRCWLKESWAEVMGAVVILLKRVIAGLSLFVISMLSTSCHSVPPGNGKPQPKNEAASRGHIPAEDKLEIESKRLAGPGAIDCGRVKIKGDPKDATECAIGAQKAAKPFRIRYDLQGIDSLVAVAIVRTPSGTVGALTYDGDPSGGGHVGEVVYRKRCPEPVHLWINPSGRINCFQQETSPPKDVMSPNAEPY